MLLIDRVQHGLAYRHGELFVSLRLLVSGVAHVSLDDRLQLVGMQPGRELGNSASKLPRRNGWKTRCSSATLMSIAFIDSSK